MLSLINESKKWKCKKSAIWYSATCWSSFVTINSLPLPTLSVSLFFPFPSHHLYLSLYLFFRVSPPHMFPSLSLPHPSPLIFPFFPSLSDLLSHYYFVVSLTILLSLTLTSILFISFNTLCLFSFFLQIPLTEILPLFYQINLHISLFPPNFPLLPLSLSFYPSIGLSIQSISLTPTNNTFQPSLLHPLQELFYFIG